MICYRDRVRSGVREITHSIVVEFDSISFQKGTSYLKELLQYFIRADLDIISENACNIIICACSDWSKVYLQLPRRLPQMRGLGEKSSSEIRTENG